MFYVKNVLREFPYCHKYKYTKNILVYSCKNLFYKLHFIFSVQYYLNVLSVVVGAASLLPFTALLLFTILG